MNAIENGDVVRILPSKNHNYTGLAKVVNTLSAGIGGQIIGLTRLENVTDEPEFSWDELVWMRSNEVEPVKTHVPVEVWVLSLLPVSPSSQRELADNPKGSNYVTCVFGQRPSDKQIEKQVGSNPYLLERFVVKGGIPTKGDVE